jgi:hypothetical protein
MEWQYEADQILYEKRVESARHAWRVILMITAGLVLGLCVGLVLLEATGTMPVVDPFYTPPLAHLLPWRGG